MDKISSSFCKERFWKSFYAPFDEERLPRKKIFSLFRREILNIESPFEFYLLLKEEKNYQREKNGHPLIALYSEPFIIKIEIRIKKLLKYIQIPSKLF